MIDPRNTLFSEIHRTWLKPLRFRKIGRKSVRLDNDGASLTVTLESYPTAPGGPHHFSIEVRANWASRNQDDVTYCLSLPSYATRQQFWSFGSSDDFEEVAKQARKQFEILAVPALRKMQSLEGMLELFHDIPKHIGIHWYYKSHLNLLNRLGRQQEGTLLLQQIIDTTPHEGLAEAAKKLLTQQALA